ncbi:helix-turn-helix domain-containing protein [Brucella intermedia]|nr:helix-turn-helix domain-containing protein [Brucella intermedia]MCO7739355.1 helix-turn-helix domain-containing protein [Brucella intermedia]
MESDASNGSRITVLIPQEVLGRIVGWRNLHRLVMPAVAPMTRVLFSYLQNLQSLSGTLDGVEAQSALDAMSILLGARSTAPRAASLKAFQPIYLYASASSPISTRTFPIQCSGHALSPRTCAFPARASTGHSRWKVELQGSSAPRGWTAPIAFLPMNAGGMYLKEIAYRCGFHDGTQFKAFKARFGMSPRDARDCEADLLTPVLDKFDYTIYLSEVAKLGIIKP